MHECPMGGWTSDGTFTPNGNLVVTVRPPSFRQAFKFRLKRALASPGRRMAPTLTDLRHSETLAAPYRLRVASAVALGARPGAAAEGGGMLLYLANRGRCGVRGQHGVCEASASAAVGGTGGGAGRGRWGHRG